MIELVNKQFRRFIKLNCSIEMSLSELLEELREIYIYGPETQTEYEEEYLNHLENWHSNALRSL